MTPIQQQFQLLEASHHGASLQVLADGSYLITIPSVALPSGWNKSTTSIKFVAPVGYPLSRPDCFWTDPDLRLHNGNVPNASSANPIPNYEGSHWWFSWHLAAWNPNNDNLLTYVNVIKRRLHDPI